MSLTFFVFSISFWYVSIKAILKRRKILEHNRTTNAVVVDILKEKMENKKSNKYKNTIKPLYYTYIPIFSYTVDDFKFTTKHNIGYPSAKFPIGSTVEIYYDPDNPSDILVKNELSAKVIIYIMLAVSVLFTIAFIISLAQKI